jgi:bleomycin hydrolase
MKKLLYLPLLFCFLSMSVAQKSDTYEFREYKRHAATPVKSQDQTGTCWAFSTASFLESEALRLGKGDVDLSEMFVVRHIYRQKCENYVRRQGTAQLSEGGLAHDCLNAVKEYGVVPESIYPGRTDAKMPFNHGPLEKALREKCQSLVDNARNKKLGSDWMAPIDSILDAYLGAAPRKFTYNNAVFSPQSFRDFLGINPDNYVSVTSFTHHPFWTSFTLEVPDNWSNGNFYNLPLDEFMRCATHAIEKGYTMAWDADVSNSGFAAQNGIAIVPKADLSAMSSSDREKSFKRYQPEVTVNQEYRQQLFDRQETTDDHLMHIVGVLDEKNSGLFYITKNSWGEISENRGYVYVSDAYLRLNSISFTLPKEAIPQDLRRRLGLEPGEVNIERTPEMNMQPATPPTPPNSAKNTTYGRSKPAPTTIQTRPAKSSGNKKD